MEYLNAVTVNVLPMTNFLIGFAGCVSSTILHMLFQYIHEVRKRNYTEECEELDYIHLQNYIPLFSSK